MSSIRRTSELVQNVAAACREQAVGVSQISGAISQVDQVTQRNASASEELASTAEELSAQAEALRDLIGYFKVSDTHAEHEAAARTRAARPHVSWTLMPHKTASNGAAAHANGHASEPANRDADFRRF